MSQNNKRLTSVFTLCLFFVVLLTLFYAWCGQQLPDYTGPDESATADATKFYLQHKRMAVLPDDTDMVSWSSYGGTRVTRQPFNYILAALTAKLNPQAEVLKSFRFASAMSIALAMGLILFACYLFTQKIALSLATTASFAFLPQMIYLASYHNDDAGAILAGAFTLLCFVMAYRFKFSRSLLLLFAFTLGFISFNKPTIYAAVPALGLYLLYLMISQRFRLRAQDILLGIIVFLIAGGWWLLNNVMVYGFDDPFQRRITLELIAQHATIVDSNHYGTFHKYGIGIWGFITNTDYWDATIHNSIANFGQLELSTYHFVYVFFWVPLFGGLLSLIYASIKSATFRDLPFTVLIAALLFWLGLSYLFYAYFVAYVDIQFQGKYVLTAGGVFILMLAYGLTAIQLRLPEIQQWHFRYLVFVVFALGSATVSGFVMMTTVKNYYLPDELRIYHHKTIVIDLNTIKREDVRNLELERGDSGLTISATGSDPMLFLSADVCQRISRNATIEIDFTAEEKGILRVFYDIGSGFKFRHEKHLRYAKGRHDVRLDMDFDGKSCRHIRIDPLETLNKLTIHKIRVTPYWFRIKD